jgi:hypothetical protein
VADIDLDGQLEVVIGDTAGSIHCISAGGTCGTGQTDWTKFRFDLNNTGFYKPQVFLPYITTSDITTAPEDQTYSVTYAAVNAKASDGYVWSMQSNASWLGFNPTTRVLSGLPTNDDVGVYWVDVMVDNATYGDNNYFLLTVTNENDDPTIDTLDKNTATEDVLYDNVYQGSDMDPTGDVLTWSMDTNATFLTMLGSNLSGTPLNEHVGEYWVLVNLSDGQGGYAESNFTLTVENANDPPTIVGGDLKSVYEDSEYANDYDVVDMDVGDTVFTWSVLSNTTFLSIDAQGNLTGLPTNDNVGDWWVNVTVEDGYSGMDWRNFTVSVYNVNDAPFWEDVPPAEIELGITDVFYFDVNATDIDPGDVLSYSISSTKISTMTIDGGTGELNWKPDDVGTYDFNISASDSEEAIFYEFEIEVVSKNSPPAAALKSPDNGSELDVLDPEFVWEVSDIDGDEVTSDLYLSINLANIESLAEGSRIAEKIVNTTYGSALSLEKGETYYWTVVPHDGSEYGKCSSGVWSFSIKEDAVVQDHPPYFTSMPSTSAMAGSEWTYSPTAVDDDGDDVAIDYVSMPTGMTYAGGVLSWTPGPSDAGTHLVNISATANGKTVYQEFDLHVSAKMDDDIEPDDDDDTGLGSVGLWIVLLAVALIVIIAIVLALVFIMKRKKEEPPAEEEPSAALEAEVESDDIFKQKDQAPQYSAVPAQPMDQGAAAYQQPETMAPQPEADVAGMPEVEATPQVDAPAQEQLPAWGEGAPQEEVEVDLPEEEAAPDMEDPYAGEVEVQESGGMKQLESAEDQGLE